MSKVYTAIGLMSGTSMDGIDAALVDTDGADYVRPRAAIYIPYDTSMRTAIESGLQEARAISDRSERPGELRSTEERLTVAHAQAVRKLLETARIAERDVDIVGFHGQTVIHLPDRGLTVQIGDGQMLADMTGIDVVGDFRAADMVAGGQGAPLVPAYHKALARFRNVPVPAAFVNIGGISNITWIGGAEELLAFDIGPGNVLLDEWCLLKTGNPIDRDGELAARGSVDDGVLAELLSDAYFGRPPPKSLDRKDYTIAAVEGMSPEDGAATLTAFTAEAIARAAQLCPEPPKVWIICGGGRRNPTLMTELHTRLNGAVHKCEAFGFHGDEMEAEAFGYLAVRSLKALPLTFPGTTGAESPVSGGVTFHSNQAA